MSSENDNIRKSRVFVAGHNGMVGSAICRALRSHLSLEIVTRSRQELDLLNQAAVREFFQSENIDQVYLAAAKVGGIHANSTYPADFIHENLVIQSNVIDAAHRANVQKLLFLGSSCIYPRLSAQPMAESELLTSALEPTNEPYAIAKIAGIKLCEAYSRQYSRDYRSVMPTNLYGTGDNFHPENSHVIPALIQRFYEVIEQDQPSIVIWGTGSPMREFLYVDDMAAASVHVMDLDSDRYQAACPPTQSHINIGTGEDCTIKELALTLADISGFQGEVVFDATKPDGTPRKLLDVQLIHSLGWKHQVSLREGLASTWRWFVENKEKVRSA